MNDTALVNSLINQVTSCDLSEIETKQITFIAEELFLSHYRASGKLQLGVITWLQHLADIYFRDDPQQAEKSEAFQQLIHAIRHPSHTLDYKTIKAFLADNQTQQTVGASTAYQRETYSLQWRTIHDIPTPSLMITQYGHALVLPPNADVCVIGDSHGDRLSTAHIVEKLIQFEQQSPTKRPIIVFLGDYVNNGLNSLGNLLYVLQLKKDFPENIVLLNGNHEFKETYLTAFKESFFIHWHNYMENPYGAAPPNHYGHFRFDLVKTFGVDLGEDIYQDFMRWGLSLPYICFDQGKKLMMSHSLGKTKSCQGKITLADLVYGKDNEAESFALLGFEAWKKQQETSHAALINNRHIPPELVSEFRNLGIEHFLIGHTHYLSGEEHDGVTTLCSSSQDSRDAGHYMYQEMNIERQKLKKDGTSPCYVCWDAHETAFRIHFFNSLDSGI